MSQTFKEKQMICVTKNNLEQSFSEVREKIESFLSDEKEVYVDLLTKQQYKNAKQNKTFHALLDCFWKSGCSSFMSKDEMRFYYKRSVGLIDMVFDNSNISEDTKNMLWKAIKLLPLENTQQIEVINLLRGKVIKERSWSIATKKQATEAIDMILHDMDMAGVSGSSEGKHYEEILEGMGDEWWNRG